MRCNYNPSHNERKANGYASSRFLYWQFDASTKGACAYCGYGFNRWMGSCWSCKPSITGLAYNVFIPDHRSFEFADRVSTIRTALGVVWIAPNDHGAIFYLPCMKKPPQGRRALHDYSFWIISIVTPNMFLNFERYTGKTSDPGRLEDV